MPKLDFTQVQINQQNFTPNSHGNFILNKIFFVINKLSFCSSFALKINNSLNA